MKINFTHAQTLLKAFDFPNLFREELGWEPIRYAQDVTIGEDAFHLDALAHKRGFTAFRCHGKIPPYAVRRKIDAQVAKSYHEHLIIYTDPAQTTQVWQWVKRQIGKPAASRGHTFQQTQSGLALLQKLDFLAITLDDEEALTILDVADRVRRGFDVEHVTKRFYDRFKDEHAAFLKFVTGIPEEGMQRWYVSVTLNRLMFVYFIQKKGFLDGNLDYLPHKLAESKQKGKNKFYREFLCPLFFKGFACKEHDPETVRLLGKVPYLNGGIFAKHQIEELHGAKLDIPDQAFERLFGFFEAYQWHLDERPLRQDDEINPDVLGYIFEKYINQKQMGAYYTKEDITEYISKNTVLPHLFDVARKECKIAFEGERSIWNLLRENSDRYIYEAVRKGVDLPLPPEIAAGIEAVSKRTRWNMAASEEYALPTETWREVVRGKLSGGEVHEINDLITYNLDIRQFAQDVIENAETPELLRAFWKAIRSVTVLDPTVGSGAFLFAALNILDPLYEACLERMQVFVDELDASKKPHSPEKFSDFRKVLAEVERHPNRRYFVLKSIIINNLYGVDIMDEAVEICKLRLFLKLVAQVEQAGQVEPLPDIDFNIRAGNTLVGFATKEDVRKAVEMTSGGQMKLVSTEDNAILKSIEEKAQTVERLFGLFRQQQTKLGGEVTPADKDLLRSRLKELEDELNIHLARQYGIHDYRSKEYDRWRESHKPFHWFLEFFGIMREGGFDIIIGNPPYLNLAGFKDYGLIGYSTLLTGNLYSMVLERGQYLNLEKGWQGYIVPVSSTATEGYLPLQKEILKRELFVSCYDDRPAHLFNDLDKNTLSIILMGGRVKSVSGYATRLCRWSGDERTHLFESLKYQPFQESKLIGCIAKIGTSIEESIWKKLWAHDKPLASYYSKYSKHAVFYSRKVNSFLQVLDFTPEVRDGKGSLRPPSEFKELTFETDLNAKSVYCGLSSSLFRWFVDVTTDGSHLNKREIDNFPFDPFKFQSKQSDVLGITKRLSKNLLENSEVRVMKYTHDTLSVQCIISKHAKPIIDEIDRALAGHYGLTDEELDFIINYDIKYRMGAGFEIEDIV
jgi:hypothetical protein